jgi:CBS domain containing-hemolysin-like protein
MSPILFVADWNSLLDAFNLEAVIIGSVILALLTLLATIDIAVSRLSDVNLRRLVSESEETLKQKSTSILKEILENRPRFRFVLSTALQIIQVGFTALVVYVATKAESDRLDAALYGFGVSVVLSILFRQFVPYIFLRNESEKKLIFLLPIARPLYLAVEILSRPFISITEPKDIHTSSGGEKDEKDEEDDHEDLQALIEVGEAEGIIEEKERELIETMVEFSDTRAGEIMTPRPQISALPIDATVKQARDAIIENRYSRLPVYRETIDNIEGVVYVRDLLNAWADGKEDQKITSLLRPAFFVPETKTAPDLLKSMQANHVQIAIVIDEYGGVAGVITIEDIVEEIVGEIEDEDIETAETTEILPSEDGCYVVNGSTEIDKIERLFEIDLEDEEFNTIAGLVTSELGYVPAAGDELQMHGLRIVILEADEKKIFRLKLSRDESRTESDERAD